MTANILKYLTANNVFDIVCRKSEQYKTCHFTLYEYRNSIRRVALNAHFLTLAFVIFAKLLERKLLRKNSGCYLVRNKIP